jgi:5'-deoxynucleotidase YfbR-like HD superfamily hydrolase
MALIHDLAESVIGDIPTFAGVAKGKFSKFSYRVREAHKCHLK